VVKISVQQYLRALLGEQFPYQAFGRGKILFREGSRPASEAWTQFLQFVKPAAQAEKIIRLRCRALDFLHPFRGNFGGLVIILYCGQHDSGAQAFHQEHAIFGVGFEQSAGTLPFVEAQGVDLAGEFAVGEANFQNGSTAVFSGCRANVIVGEQERLTQNQLPAPGSLIEKRGQPLQPVCSARETSFNVPEKIDRKI
jgi:hypothetical protein